jgi:hypothetical protein
MRANRYNMTENSELRAKIDEAKRRLPMPELMKQLGLGEYAKKSARCPLHEDRHNSFSIWQRDGVWFWKCHTSCGDGDEITFLERHKGISRGEAIRFFVEMAGVNGSERIREHSSAAFPLPSQRQASNGEKAFNWQQCISGLKAKDLIKLGNERWYSRAFCEWLHEKRLVGLYSGGYAFPVQKGTGVAGTHYHVAEGWRYHPAGTKTQPFVIGDLTNAKQVHLFESQWDLLALADRTDLYQNEHHSFIATRGAKNAGLLKGLIPAGASVLVWPQNDAAGQKWLSDLGAHVGTTFAKAVVPPQYKDVNDWTKAGASAEELYRAMWRNEAVYEPPRQRTFAELLDDLCAFLQRYVVFAIPEQPVAIALWVIHSWALNAFDYTPYLHVASPEKQCGKTRLLDCLELLTPNPWRAILPSEAVLFRKIEMDRPALLLDEVDAIFTNGKDDRKEPLRALLNNGFSRGATVPRCVAPTFQIRDFRVFCAKALAGIGKLPDTVRDRSIPIQLVRRSRDERVERFRKREAEKAAATIRSELEAWSQKTRNIDTLRDARPSVPDELSDRQADISEPLLAVADLAGREWPERARTALVTLCSQTDEDESLGVKLLCACRDAFNGGEADKLSTQQLLKILVDQEGDVPWASWWEHDLNNGNTRGPAQKLARLLKPYRIQARTIRLADNTTPRGYTREDFEEAWKRYCPPELHPGCNNAT